MRINNNMMAMNTHRQLGIATTGGAKSMEKLSSGFRINRAGDDAAGLAISEKMRGQIRGLGQASRNAQDGISLIQTAEGALDETHAILQRMRELAVQSSTDTNTDADRANIQDEIDQLSAEITRISETTEFNTMKLLDGSFEGKKFHIGANQNQDITFDVNNMSSSALKLKSDITVRDSGEVGTGSNISISVADGGKANIEFKQATKPSASGDNTVDDDDAKVDVAVDAAGKITVTMGKDGATLEDLKAALADKGVSVNVVDAGTVVGLENLIGQTKQVGDFNQAGFTVGGADFVITNADVKEIDVIEGGQDTKTSVKFEAGKLSITIGADATSGFDPDKLNALILAEVKGVVVTNTTDITLAAGKKEDIELTLESEGTDVDKTVGLNVSTQASASKAITTVNSALENVSRERSKLGSIQNRLEHTIKNLDTSAENLQASEARIRDVDMAKEMMEQTKQNILQQASTAMLAQANQAPQTVLQLLR